MSKHQNVGANALLEGKGTAATNARWVTISPALAEKLLENNRLNRPLKEGHGERLAAQMKKGLWRGDNGETMKFTKEGDILDGQHRLWALIESDTTQRFLVIDGLDSDVMPTIDTGRARSMADVLSIAGGKNAVITASVLRWLWWYPKRGKVASGPDMRDASHQQLLDFQEKHPDIHDRISEVLSSTKTIKRYMAPSILAFVYTLEYRQDPAKAGAWLTWLDSGLGIDDERHPVHQLRERLLKNAAEKSKLKLTPVEVCALAIKSWNNFVTGKRTKELRWRNEEEFPTLLSAKDVATERASKVA